jgi:hypothetical protein
MDHLDILRQHACLGFKALGFCDYDPAKPFAVYFAPGAAVGALAFTLAVQQLLKPVHRFRLSARYLTLPRIYVLDTEKYRADVLETLVEIVFEALAAVSNKFKGTDDPFWIMVIQAAQRIYPSFSGVPDGLTPFQQRLALKLTEQLRDNMNGYYPAICRVLLAWVGPYVHRASQRNRTAFNILKDAVYFELQNLPQLAAEKPDKIGHYLPNNVTFDSLTTDLVHTYRSGTPAVTRLSTLNLEPISLVAKDIRNTHAVRLAIVNLLRQRSTKLAAKGRVVSGGRWLSRRLTLRPKADG